MAGTIEFRADRAKNRLYLTISGFFRNRDVGPAMENLDEVLRQLKPGFDTITDLSGFVPGAPGASAALKEGGEKIRVAGRRRGVRITGGLMTGLMQFQRMLKGVFDDQNTRYAKSIQEAEAILNNWNDSD
jgi:hypothetical protein